MMIFVVKTVPVADLVKKLETGKRFSKESVIRESKFDNVACTKPTLIPHFLLVVTKAQDPDIVATSTILSLKCPLSASRINLPCRSSSCQHTQCFDATSYMQLQEQGPTWSCPICSKSAPFESLAVDEYVNRAAE
jgi:E3 SUMO-protein ligase PIAS1